MSWRSETNRDGDGGGPGASVPPPPAAAAAASSSSSQAGQDTTGSAVAVVKRPRKGLCRLVPSQLASTDYENKELEVLYRRYILKLQQNSISSALLLLELVLLTMFITGAVYSWPRTLGLSVSALLNAVLALVLLLLFAFLSSRLMQDALLMPLCLAIMIVAALFALASLPLPALHVPMGGYASTSGNGVAHDSVHQQVSAADGMWEIVFVLFVCYTMLPTRVRYVISLGVALPIIHSLVAAHTATAQGSLLREQVSGNSKTEKENKHVLFLN